MGRNRRVVLALFLAFYLLCAGLLTMILSTTTLAAAEDEPCTHAVTLSLVVDPPSPQLGDWVTATATLTNTGDCLVGLPQYTLAAAVEVDGAVTVDTENPVTHSLGLDGGQADMAQFGMVILNRGTVTLTVSTSFEVHLGYPGPAYWSGATSTPVTFTVPVTSTGLLVMVQSAHRTACYATEYNRTSLTFDERHFGCAVAAGHGVAATIDDYASNTAAIAAFLAATEGRTLLPFAGCRVAYLEAEGWLGPMVKRTHLWTAGPRLVRGIRYDDTDLVQTNPSQAVHDVLIENGLLEPCRDIYLPILTKR